MFLRQVFDETVESWVRVLNVIRGYIRKFVRIVGIVRELFALRNDAQGLDRGSRDYSSNPSAEGRDFCARGKWPSIVGGE